MSVGEKVATAVGGGLALSGLLFSASFIGWRGDPAITFVLGDYPNWAILGFLGGGILMVLGAIIGLRYGNLERYHESYNPETGRIEGHWFGQFADRVTTDTYGTAPDEAPEKFDPDITFGKLFAGFSVLLSPLLVYLGYEVLHSDFLGWRFFVLAVVLFVSSAAASACVGVQVAAAED